MRASILLLSLSLVGGAFAMLGACVGDDNTNPPDAAGDATTNDGAPGGDGAADGGADGSADAGPSFCQDASGAFIDATSFISPSGVAHAAVAVADGHVIAGEYRTVASYGGDAAVTSPNGNTQEFFVAHVKSDGSVLWQVGYGGNGSDWINSVAVDDAGDVYVAGYSSEYATLGLAQSKFNFSAVYTTQDAGIIAKLDGKTGAVVWSQAFTNGRFTYGCSRIDFDSGHLVASCGMGATQAYVGLDGGAGLVTANQAAAASIYELDPATGKVVWARGLTTYETDAGTPTYVDSVDVTPNNVVVSGTFAGSQLVDTPSHAIDLAHVGNVTNGNQSNGFVVELAAANGAPAWVKGFGDATGTGTVGSTFASGSSATGGIVVGGSFTGNVDFGTGPHASVGSQDGFVVMLKNKAGNPAWEKYFDGSQVDDIGPVRTEPCGGSVFLLDTGSTLSAMDGVTFPAPQSGGNAALVGKLDAAGKLLWVNGVTPGGSPDNNGIDPYDLAVGADDHSVTVGDFRGTIDLGTGTPVSPVGGSGPYMITYKP